MTDISEIVSVSITAETTGVTQAGFGTPLIAAYHTNFADRVRTYTSLTGMVADGFAATDPAYLCAQKAFSATPRIQRIKVGKRDSAPTQSVTLTPTDTTEGLVYTVTVTGPGATSGETFTYTCGAAETVAGITAGLVFQMAGRTGLWTPTDNTTDIDVTATVAGDLFNFQMNAELTFHDDTADPGLAADLALIAAADTDWYCLLLDSNGEAEINAAAAWTESQRKIFVAHSADSNIATNSTTDVASDLNAASYDRTALITSYASGNLSYASAALAGKMLPTDPGSATWTFKTLSGITRDSLTTTQAGYILGKKANAYQTIGGVNVTRYGTAASGEYMDVTRFVDWLQARLEERIFSLLVNNSKLPYTDASVDLIRAEILAQLRQGITVGGLSGDPEPVVTAPKVADVSTTDKANRLLPDVQFSATLAGAIHKVTIEGTVSL